MLPTFSCNVVVPHFDIPQILINTKAFLFAEAEIHWGNPVYLLLALAWTIHVNIGHDIGSVYVGESGEQRGRSSAPRRNCS
jgi:hypothetical protein